MGDYLYMWGGNIDGLPRVHDNEVKRRMTSVIELFHLPTGRWEQRPTNGKPPLGVSRYASTVISNRIYYFGGYCNHDKCRHNSVNSLITDSLTWNELFPTDPSMGPMMKSSCGMISLTFNKVDYLLVFGGHGPRGSPSSRQPGAEYIVPSTKEARTNEHHYYQLSSGKKINISCYQYIIHQVQFYNCLYFRSVDNTIHQWRTPTSLLWLHSYITTK